MSGTLTRTAAEFLQCSFRGVPFAVVGGGGSNGRRLASHTYPYRDGIEVEDLGKAARSYRIAGFVVGPFAYAQRDLLVTAAETKGSGLLMHPTIGVVQAHCVRFEWRERDGVKNVVDLDFEFVEKTNYLSNMILTSLHAAIGVAALAMSVAAASDYASNTSASFAEGSSVNRAAVAVASGWSTSATQAANSPQALSSAASVLPGNNGRYAAGNGGLTDPNATEASVIDELTADRATIAAAVSNVAAANGASEIAAAVFALTEAVRASLADPGAQIALLLPMVACAPVVTTSSAPIGAAIATVQTATAALCRQAALYSIAQACSDWTPASSDDAQALSAQVAALFDAEATIAADAGDDATWQAMRDLQAQVTQDLANRAARLPDIVTITRNAPLPALLLAQQLYADATRSDELIQRADPIHPAFMPTEFKALSS
ncbi:bacteriophage protein [Neoasaia chiangmaiensis NBRC 101099]|uniref:Uncharacterized protein n=1 Tax=Neoasaia chiangmaiensis TaxID=320497 RepID=A0A1U9KQZ8_9PROT|nr:DNA circularization N-terminal domain-containing protein [Neoasaia chiangmaiensis]AQS88274.1 hypothetical protein A0U93_10340 [Neoasaia chiangmaiensis]GBR39676.1 bacteriophage protein [Neoasaia chiangmaiensis NBRC 101099]GEN14692.1 hypothetical protein NCH01_11230 [Neoasaia chiangmaiensis]